MPNNSGPVDGVACPTELQAAAHEAERRAHRVGVLARRTRSRGRTSEDSLWSRQRAVRELFRTGRRSDVVRRDQRRGPAWLATFILILVGGCTTSPAPPAQVRPSNHAIAHSFAGGCAGTVLTDAEPPVWAQTGFAKQTPWPVPWAFGTQDTAVAFLFSTVLVAGSSPRLDGSYNKVGWVAKGDYSTGNTDIAIEVRPLGESQPVS